MKSLNNKSPVTFFNAYFELIDDEVCVIAAELHELATVYFLLHVWEAKKQINACLTLFVSRAMVDVTGESPRPVLHPSAAVLNRKHCRLICVSDLTQSVRLRRPWTHGHRHATQDRLQDFLSLHLSTFQCLRVKCLMGAKAGRKAHRGHHSYDTIQMAMRENRD